MILILNYFFYWYLCMAYIFGFDLGVASVGWSVIDPDKRIVDLGVRAFKKAETDKEGAPLNLIRRTSRLNRRRLYRRAHRLNKLLNFLIKSGLITTKEEILKNEYNDNPWELRTVGLRSVLTNNQLARVIYHICKHRGFYWASSAESEREDDNGKIKKSLFSNQKLMEEKGYKTVGQMIYTEYPNCQRNKDKDYSKSLPRAALAEELSLLFHVQKVVFSNPIITDEFCKAILGTGDKRSGFLWEQKPALQGDKLLEMVGHCRFESEELRAPTASYWSERHVWLTKVLNLRVYGDDRQERPLNDEERSLIINKAIEIKSDIKYSTLTSAFVKSGLWTAGQYRYKGIDYDQTETSKKNKSAKKDPEECIFFKRSHLHEIRTALESHKLSEEWEQIKNSILCGDYERYNRIAYVLTVYKEDEDVKEQLLKTESKDVVDALICVRFKEFNSLSEKALQKIVPYMEKGLRYDEACEAAGYTHYKQSQKKKEKTKYLPPLFSGREPNGTLVFNEEIGDIPRNPVVLRVINQTRKVVNALVKKYGSPLSVHIELARDLAKPFSERMEILKNNKENESRRLAERLQFAELFGESVLNGKNLEKFKLFKEQEEKSMYSCEPIDIHRLFEEGYVEIDHILPYSRSFDDSQANKVLVFAKENQDKGNQIPYEYFSRSKRNISWQEFEKWVKACKNLSKNKKQHLLRQNLSPDSKKEFLERNLNDTRYACKFVKNYIDRFLELAPSADKSGCVVVSGQLTSYLRKHWGLNKSREENDRHHALDATVIACCSRRMVQKVGLWSRSKENRYILDSDADIPLTDEEILLQKTFENCEKPKFPYPWEHFREEIHARVFCSDLNKLKEEMQVFCGYTENDLNSLRTLFVSRACEKIGKGALHADTVRRQTLEMRAENVAVSKVDLTKLTYSKISNIVDADTRNKNLCQALRARFENYCIKMGVKLDDLDKKDIAKIFSSDNPMHMPNSKGVEDPNNPIVKSVRIKETFSGVPVRNGVAGNGEIIRVDIFKKKEKYYCVPIYAFSKELSNRACVANKKETEWDIVDNTFEWCFSIRQNELIKIDLKKQSYFGYFNGFDRATGAVSILLHDRQDSKDHKKGEIRSIGVKTALNLVKFHVDILGNFYTAPKEPRSELA